MATRKAKFTAIPNLPQTGVPGGQAFVLTALKENVDLLIGAKGSKYTDSKAVIKGSLSVVPAPAPELVRVTAEGAGFAVSNALVPDFDDYVKLINNVQTLTNDVAALRKTLNTLIQQLKS
jgi:hypothetical protein